MKEDTSLVLEAKKHALLYNTYMGIDELHALQADCSLLST